MATETKPDVFAGLPAIFALLLTGELFRYPNPFVSGEYVYATDGKICCRIKLASVPEFAPVPDAKGPSNPSGLFAGLQSSGDAAIPEIADPTPPREEDCSNCDGTGTAECPHCEQDMDCEECDGTGKELAEYEFPKVAIGEHLFGGRLLWMMRRGGFTTIRLPIRAAKVNDAPLASAEHDGVEAVIVPLLR